MQKTFDPQDIEQACYARWEDAGWFQPSGTGAPYCIMIPPPNVTGTLHMGHAFQDTIMDALIRYHRMRGDDTLWQVGTDHAGIATQMVVERQLDAEGKSRHDLGRDAFVERVWEWKKRSGGAITDQLRRLGASVDWSRERFTMEPALSEAVTEVFVRLYDDGLIYRGKRLVNWDPVLHTALSDLEVVSQEEAGHLWHLRYPLSDGSGHLVVATTRPETMLGDVAVAVHPDDERHSHLVGSTITLPLTDRQIPIIADDYVDPEFGSGCVKITPAHDFNDYDIGKRHDLPMITVLDFNACINDNAPAPYRGMPRFEARQRIVDDLQALGLLERIEEHRSAVPRGDRSHEVLEPLLTDQWYVSVAELAEPAIEAVRSGRIRFVPENWDRTYYEWMNNIQDWCISRQLWWGHRIPAWYTPDGQIIVAHDETEARKRGGLDADVPLRQDEDVLDTWFSSALWPFSTLGWPHREDDDLERYYPTAVLVTGFDIIFFWVARMIMMGLRFMGEVPFREIYIHGLLRDAEGQKMSKSKGNVLDPIDLIDGTTLDALLAKRTAGLMQPQQAKAIEKATRKQFPQGIPAFGTDALRFTFMAMATTGRDIRFDLGRIEGYRNFCNKLWNASRYVLMNCEGKPLDGEGQLGEPDRWIRSRLGRTLEQVDEHFSRYRFDLAAQALYDFTWNEFCDWYLELTKPVLRDADENGPVGRGTRRNMLEVLEALLRALHPMMPFITETLWTRVAPLAGREGETVMREPWPDAGNYSHDPEAERNMHWVTDFVLGIRQIRGEMDISPSKALPALLQDAGPGDRDRLRQFAPLLTQLARLERIEILDAGLPPAACATALVGQMRLLVPLEGLVDIGEEIARIGKRLSKQRDELNRIVTKLSNANFVERAPAEVVEEQRRRQAELEGSVAKLREQLERLEGSLG